MIELSTLLKPVVLLFVVTYNICYEHYGFKAQGKPTIFNSNYGIVVDTLPQEVFTIDSNMVNKIIKTYPNARVDTFVLTPYKH